MKTSSEKTIEKYQEVLKSASNAPIMTSQNINAITKIYKINKTWYSYAVKLGILERNDRGVYKMLPYKATRENAAKLLKTMNEKQSNTSEENCCGSLANTSDLALVDELRKRGYTVRAEKHITL